MKKIILSLGGSLIVPGTVDAAYLRQFRQLILSQLDAYQFIIFAGGGKTCREYQQGLRVAREDATTDEQLDWIGIYSSWLNARLLQQLFVEQAAEEIIIDPSTAVESDRAIVIGGGWKPGWSTDYDAVQSAIVHGITRVVNLSNIEYVYDKDPALHDDAEAIKEIRWADFQKIVGDEWTPGLNMPFDPIASKLAEKHGIEVIVANGADIENIRAILEEGKKFNGTRIY